MTASIRGKIIGSAKYAFSKADFAHIAWTALYVALAAIFTYFMSLVPHLPEGAPQGLGLVLTALCQAAVKYFSDTRNIPVAAAGSVTTGPAVGTVVGTGGTSIDGGHVGGSTISSGGDPPGS
jgi:hypothetical protein